MIAHGYFGAEMASHVNSPEEAHRFLDYILKTTAPNVKSLGYMVISLYADDFLPGDQHWPSGASVSAGAKGARKSSRSPFQRR